jgi:dipeptidase
MCDSVVATGAATATHETLYGKNSDRKPGECQPFVQIVEAWHPPRATVRCTHVEIPQVPETYRVMGHSPWWVWGFEHGVNEHAVAIGNHTIFAHEPVEETPGLIGMDLVRLGLERGRSAREALEVVATLIETHGQGGSALAPGAGGYHNSFVLADPVEAWQLEAVNRRWVARRVTCASVSNHMSIGADWEIASRDFEAYSRYEGVWTESDRIDAAAAWRDRRIPDHISEGRCGRAAALLAEGAGHLDVAAFQRILRDHGAGGAVWRDAGAGVDEERLFTLCAHSEPVHWTTASLVASLPSDRDRAWPVWISFGTPCTGLFLPVYLLGVIPPALGRDGETPDDESAWWVFKALQDEASRDTERHTPWLREQWRPLESRIEEARLRMETDARRALAEEDVDRASELASRFMSWSVDAALDLARELRAKLA